MTEEYSLGNRHFELYIDGERGCTSRLVNRFTGDDYLKSCTAAGPMYKLYCIDKETGEKVEVLPESAVNIEQWGATFTSERVPSPSAAGYNEAAQVYTGWPWRTMRWTAANDVWKRWAGIAGSRQVPEGIVREGIELPRFFANPNLAERRIPLDPIAAGWVKSLCAYVPVAMLGVFAAVYLRRGMRIRRGCCPACGYPVENRDICAECGLAFAAVAQGGLS